jgi:hypothetical protein
LFFTNPKRELREIADQALNLHILSLYLRVLAARLVLRLSHRFGIYPKHDQNDAYHQPGKADLGDPAECRALRTMAATGLVERPNVVVPRMKLSRQPSPRPES